MNKLRPEDRLINRVVQTCIALRAGDTDSVKMQDIYILHFLLLNRKFSFPRFMIRVMKIAAAEKTKSRSLPYGRLLSKVFQHCGVKLDQAEKAKPTKEELIDQGTLERMGISWNPWSKSFIDDKARVLQAFNPFDHPTPPPCADSQILEFVGQQGVQQNFDPFNYPTSSHVPLPSSNFPSPNIPSFSTGTQISLPPSVEIPSEPQPQVDFQTEIPPEPSSFQFFEPSSFSSSKLDEVLEAIRRLEASQLSLTKAQELHAQLLTKADLDELKSSLSTSSPPPLNLLSPLLIQRTLLLKRMSLLQIKPTLSLHS